MIMLKVGLQNHKMITSGFNPNDINSRNKFTKAENSCYDKFRLLMINKAYDY